MKKTYISPITETILSACESELLLGSTSWQPTNATQGVISVSFDKIDSEEKLDDFIDE